MADEMQAKGDTVPSNAVEEQVNAEDNPVKTLEDANVNDQDVKMPAIPMMEDVEKTAPAFENLFYAENVPVTTPEDSKVNELNWGMAAIAAVEDLVKLRKIFQIHVEEYNRIREENLQKETELIALNLANDRRTKELRRLATDTNTDRRLKTDKNNFEAEDKCEAVKAYFQQTSEPINILAYYCGTAMEISREEVSELKGKDDAPFIERMMDIVRIHEHIDNRLEHLQDNAIDLPVTSEDVVETLRKELKKDCPAETRKTIAELRDMHEQQLKRAIGEGHAASLRNIESRLEQVRRGTLAEKGKIVKEQVKRIIKLKQEIAVATQTKERLKI